ncbi:hypothetical protein PLESTB_000799200 [Pleodorina starrii]|uniref:Uncharacterized protein n=1 Tax=Pleodorina starrii TaxID=330485 RepID=A0A9W6BLD4_9CHLO|nr:hypothetical protein PLESTM_000633000 [Pleodorina starrii]GLC53875.1 hypothetical protein PLESTB_000799200 [Pleodorina starrii]GLC75438.1 hypothetical protein PLESTF_001636700 [Pleodorina starrii]
MLSCAPCSVVSSASPPTWLEASSGGSIQRPRRSGMCPDRSSSPCAGLQVQVEEALHTEPSRRGLEPRGEGALGGRSFSRSGGGGPRPCHDRRRRPGGAPQPLPSPMTAGITCSATVGPAGR